MPPTTFTTATRLRARAGWPRGSSGSRLRKSSRSSRPPAILRRAPAISPTGMLIEPGTCPSRHSCARPHVDDLHVTVRMSARRSSAEMRSMTAVGRDADSHAPNPPSIVAFDAIEADPQQLDGGVLRVRRVLGAAAAAGRRAAAPSRPSSRPSRPYPGSPRRRDARAQMRRTDARSTTIAPSAVRAAAAAVPDRRDAARAVRRGPAAAGPPDSAASSARSTAACPGDRRGRPR